jgi:ABC-type dipeptide/oligopeptide/nickel transport system permease component
VSMMLLRRLLQLPIVLLGVVTLTFLIVQLTPGDLAAVMAGDFATPETIEAIRRSLGLDRPVWEQFVTYLGNFLQLDFGTSLLTGRPVIEEIARTFPNTLELVVVAFVFSAIPGLLIGTLAALRPGGVFDKLAMIGALAGLSVPTFVAGLMLILVFAVTLGILPTSGRDGPLFMGDNWTYAILPAFALSLGPLGSLARVTRSAVLEVLPEDYVRTARAKGLSETVVLLKHVWRNSSIPVLTLLGLQLGYFLGGSVVIETVFGWPGMGRLSVQAILNRDFPLVQGTIAVFAVVYVLVNLLVDVGYGVIDPRIRTRR